MSKSWRRPRDEGGHHDKMQRDLDQDRRDHRRERPFPKNVNPRDFLGEDEDADLQLPT